MSNEHRCPNCGTAVTATAKFCRKCGTALQGAAAPVQASAPRSPEEKAVLSKMTDAQKVYGGLLEDLRAGKIDEETFRKGVLPYSVIVREREAWIMDASVGRWLYYDGVQVRDLDAER